MEYSVGYMCARDWLLSQAGEDSEQHRHAANRCGRPGIDFVKQRTRGTGVPENKRGRGHRHLPHLRTENRHEGDILVSPFANSLEDVQYPTHMHQTSLRVRVISTAPVLVYVQS